MKPETLVYLDIARGQLDDATFTLDAGLFRVAAREAYLGALNAARALIFEVRDRTSKTHGGTRSLMHELLPEWPEVTRDAIEVLTTGFDHKTLADYGSLVGSKVVTADDARDTLASARKLMHQVEAALSRMQGPL